MNRSVEDQDLEKCIRVTKSEGGFGRSRTRDENSKSTSKAHFFTLLSKGLHKNYITAKPCEFLVLSLYVE